MTLREFREKYFVIKSIRYIDRGFTLILNVKDKNTDTLCDTFSKDFFWPEFHVNPQYSQLSTRGSEIVFENNMLLGLSIELLKKYEVVDSDIFDVSVGPFDEIRFTQSL